MSNIRLNTVVFRGDSEQREIVERLTNFIVYRDIESARAGMERNRELIEIASNAPGTMTLLSEDTGETLLSVPFNL